MASSALLKLACVVVLCMVVAAPHAEAAITCGAVSQNLEPCVAYLTGGPSPSAGCCGGLKSLASMASTPADRKTACGCLKSAAAAVPNLDNGKAAGLPGKCGISIPYAFSTSTDCSTVN